MLKIKCREMGVSTKKEDVVEMQAGKGKASVIESQEGWALGPSWSIPHLIQ